MLGEIIWGQRSQKGEKLNLRRSKLPAFAWGLSKLRTSFTQTSCWWLWISNDLTNLLNGSDCAGDKSDVVITRSIVMRMVCFGWFTSNEREKIWFSKRNPLAFSSVLPFQNDDLCCIRWCKQSVIAFGHNFGLNHQNQQVSARVVGQWLCGCACVLWWKINSCFRKMFTNASGILFSCQRLWWLCLNVASKRLNVHVMRQWLMPNALRAL